MARCEICSRRIDPNKRMCGGTAKNPECVAKDSEILPRCTKCHDIATDGMKDCVVTGGAHITEDERFCNIEDRRKKVV